MFFGLLVWFRDVGHCIGLVLVFLVGVEVWWSDLIVVELVVILVVVFMYDVGGGS